MPYCPFELPEVHYIRFFVHAHSHTHVCSLLSNPTGEWHVEFSELFLRFCN